MTGQLVLAAIPEALENLLPHVLEDAAAWREHIGDEKAAELYQGLAAELEQVADG